MSGHLFVVRGDLTQLACDAVIVPTSRTLEVTGAWTGLVPLRAPFPNRQAWYQVDEEPPAGWGESDRALPLPDDSLGRRVWLVRTDAWGRNGQWVADGMVQAVARAAAQLDPPSRRERRLVGVPLAGTGDGGLHDRRGEVVAALVPALEGAARDHGVDVALVLADDRDHAAVQARRTWSGEVACRADADRLGELAANGHLALFLGAGVSVAAGLPSWPELLQELGKERELREVRLDHLSYTDAAQAAQAAIGTERLQSLLAERFRLRRHALAHALLAGLQVESAITTNYDDGYELAAGAVLPAAPDGLRLLPYDEAVPGRPWLLKLHGDVARPGSIVLARDHYLDYAHTRAPLTGLVQGVLLTRHVLFVGFSLQDEHFARLAHQVRTLLQATTGAARRVGTLLALRQDPALALVWEDDLHQVAMGSASPAGETGEARRAVERAASRQLEVFLDRLAWKAVTTSGGAERFLLDERYDALERDPAESTLRTSLRDLRAAASAELRGTPAWRVVEFALCRLGMTER